MYTWSVRLLNSQKAHAKNQNELIAFYIEHDGHMAQLEALAQNSKDKLAIAASNYFRKEAQAWLAESRRGWPA